MTSACGLSTDAEDAENATFATGGKADGGLTVGEQAGALRAANELTLVELDDDAGLSSRAANNIAARRAGSDAVLGTSDDHVFATLAELDAVAYVGPVALGKLVDYARTHGWIAASAAFAQLRSGNIDPDDSFGASIALSGTTLVVGAPDEDSDPSRGPADNSAPGAGAVFVYERDAIGWHESAMLKSAWPSDGRFGQIVALDGDTLAITSRALNGAGTAYDPTIHVYARSGGQWDTQTRIELTEGLEIGAVAVSGQTLAVATPYAQVTGKRTGRVTVYGRTPTAWTQTAELTSAFDAPSTNLSLHFGNSIAPHGDTLAVASGTAVDGTGNDVRVVGAVDVYTRAGTTWTPQRIAPATSSTEYRGDFGTSLALDGTSLVIGASQDDGPAGVLRSGSAFVYTRSGGSWQRQARIDPPVALVNGQLGGAVAVSGDRVAIGSTGDGTVRTVFPYTDLAGAVHVYQRSGSAWSHTERRTALRPRAYADFGTSVMLDDDALIVAAPGEQEWLPSGNGNESLETLGAVYAD